MGICPCPQTSFLPMAVVGMVLLLLLGAGEDTEAGTCGCGGET